MLVCFSCVHVWVCPPGQRVVEASDYHHVDIAFTCGVFIGTPLLRPPVRFQWKKTRDVRGRLCLRLWCIGPMGPRPRCVSFSCAPRVCSIASAFRAMSHWSSDPCLLSHRSFDRTLTFSAFIASYWTCFPRTLIVNHAKSRTCRESVCFQ